MPFLLLVLSCLFSSLVLHAQDSPFIGYAAALPEAGTDFTKEHDFYRVAGISPPVRVANPLKNAATVIEEAKLAAKENAAVIAFPELFLTGYTAGDLIFNEEMRKSVEEAVEKIIEASQSIKGSYIAVGGPYYDPDSDRVYNAVYMIREGRLVGIVPKSYLPNYKEFHEPRNFSNGTDLHTEVDHPRFGKFFLGRRQVFKSEKLKIAIENCEDSWAPLSPSIFHTIKGANLIVNVSASNALIGKAEYRKNLISVTSAKLETAFLYVSSGVTEDTKDVVFDGDIIVAEAGRILKRGDRFVRKGSRVYADIDVGKITTDRLVNKTYGESKLPKEEDRYVWQTSKEPLAHIRDLKHRQIDKTPFVPSDPARFNDTAWDAFNIQLNGLLTRLDRSPHIEKLLIAVSGGLDSTLALLVAYEAAKEKGWDPKKIIGITMPGMGTTSRTKTNAHKLMEALGIDSREKSVVAASEDLLSSAKPGGEALKNDKHVAFGNAQARIRTNYALLVANLEKALMIGTGDLSEIWLGWYTFGGDNTSGYNVNASVPKTLVYFLVKWYADNKADETLKKILYDILDTPYSPELERPDPAGEIKQRTESEIGPYLLHDFFLPMHMRYQFGPKKIFELAKVAFKGMYKPIEIHKWLRVFFDRGYEVGRWKADMMAPGPKMGSVSLSPRGDWRAPAQMDCDYWASRFPATPNENEE